jgi:hypothetical protein
MRIVDCDGFSDSLKYFGVTPLKSWASRPSDSIQKRALAPTDRSKANLLEIIVQTFRTTLSLNVYEPSRKAKGKRTALPSRFVCLFGPLRLRVSGFSKRIFASAGVVQVSTLLGRVLACARALDAFHLAGAAGNLPLILPCFGQFAQAVGGA